MEKPLGSERKCATLTRPPHEKIHRMEMLDLRGSAWIINGASAAPRTERGIRRSYFSAAAAARVRLHVFHCCNCKTYSCFSKYVVSFVPLVLHHSGRTEGQKKPAGPLSKV